MTTLEDLQPVTEHWKSVYAPATAARMTELAGRFARRLDAAGVGSFAAVTTADAEGWINAPTRHGPPAVATTYWRRTTLRALYRQLRVMGVTDTDPTYDVDLARRDHRYARPLTDDEILLARGFAPGITAPSTGRRAVAWALAEAGATVGEIARVAAGDLDDPLLPSSVALPGGRGVAARRAPLTDWGRRLLAGHLARYPHRLADRLVYRGAATTAGSTTGPTRACQYINEVLTAAGLAQLPDVRPSSVRHWAGRAAYQNGTTLDEVAYLLGLSSLDATAARIGLPLPGGQAPGRLR